MTINTSKIKSLLQPTLDAVYGDYYSYPSQYSEIYTEYKSKKAYETDTEMKYLGLAQFKPEGGPIAMDDMSQFTQTNYYMRTIGLGFQMTMESLQDNLYKDKFPMYATSLKKSMLTAKETVAASVLNNAFNSAFPIGDGQPLCSTAHPIVGTTQANTPTVAVDLTEAALEAAVVSIQQFKDVSNLTSMFKPEKLIVSPQNQFTADRILHSQFRTSTNINDINSLYNTQMIPKGYRVNQFLTANPNAWFLITNADQGFKYFNRMPVQTDIYTDFMTSNMLAKAIERYSFGVSNWRAVYGSNGP